ncbi:MAG: HupE/UreJ family protein [Acidobacteriota bacterium]
MGFTVLDSESDFQLSNPQEKRIVLKGGRTIVRPRVIAALVAALILTLQFRATAHDIPNDVTVQAFLKPEGQRLHLLVRVPLRACRDVDFPTRGPGYLDLARADASLRDAATLWISDNVELYEGDARLSEPRVIAARAGLESEKFFESYEDALAHVTGTRLPIDTELYWNQGLLDVLFEYPIHSALSDFSIRPRLAGLGLRVVTVLRFLPPGGAVRAFEFEGDPGLVRLDPRWHQAALRFVEAGFLHILDGTDHLLFLFCLVIPFRRFRPLIMVVTAFTVAHSITLIASAYNLGPDALWFPPLIETLIAVSIIYMALENIVGSNVQRRWMIALGFGLVHGFGFSFALRQTLQFGGSHLLTSLLSFNIGVELGQLLVLALLIPALQVLFRFVVAERVGTIILSALVAHAGWHWMIERAERLRQFGWPVMNAALLATAMRWLIVILILAGVIWLAGVLRHRAGRVAEGAVVDREDSNMANDPELMIQSTTKPRSN